MSTKFVTRNQSICKRSFCTSILTRNFWAQKAVGFASKIPIGNMDSKKSSLKLGTKDGRNMRPKIGLKNAPDCRTQNTSLAV
jgi:hypothetical protein